MSRIPGGAITTASRSMPTKPKAAASPAFWHSAIRPAASRCAPKNAPPPPLSRSTCAAPSRSGCVRWWPCYPEPRMPRELLDAYPPATARYDEMLEAPLTPRAHWRQIVDELIATPPELMRDRLKAVQRQVREDGVTYNVHADPYGADRPWDLDVLPMILPHG